MINSTIPELIVNAKSNSDGLMMIVDYWIKIYTGDKTKVDSKWILKPFTKLPVFLSINLSISINHIHYTHHTPGVSGHWKLPFDVGHPQGSRAALQSRSASVHAEVGGLVQ